MDLTNVPIPEIGLDTPDMKKARIESKTAELDTVTTRRYSLNQLIETKEMENQDTGERYEVITGLNQYGLFKWFQKFYPMVNHAKLPDPYILKRDNTWYPVEKVQNLVHNITTTETESVLEETYGTDLMPDNVYKSIKALARDFVNQMNVIQDPAHPLVAVQAPNIVPFNNGLFNMTKDGFNLKPIEPEDYIVNTIPYDLIECDENDVNIQYIRDFLEWLVGDSTELLIAYMGFVFYRSQEKINTMLLLINGDTNAGGNGKSQVIKLFKAMLGGQNSGLYSVKALDKISDKSDRFSRVDLKDKFANISDEADGFIKDTQLIKNITGGGELDEEPKGKQGLKFTPYAKLIMAVNHVPDYRDDSEGMARRWIAIPFTKDVRSEENRKMWETAGSKFSDEMKDKYMFNDEALGKWAYYCMRKFIEATKDRFNGDAFKDMMTKEAHSILDGMSLDNDPVAQFLDINNLEITKDYEDYVIYSELIDLYKEKQDPTNRKSVTAFIKDLAGKGAITKQQVGKTTRTPRKFINQKHTNIIRGIKFVDNTIPDEEAFPNVLSNGTTRTIDDKQVAEQLEKELFE